MGSSDTFPLDPDYAVTEQYDDGMLRSDSIGGNRFARLVRPPRRQFHLVFNQRSAADKDSLLQFYREMEATYFVLEHPCYLLDEGVPLERVFPAHFAGPPKFSHAGSDCYDMECDLLEAVGCQLESGDYPDPTDGHPTATIAGVVSGADQIFVYGGYGFTYTGTGTLALDGVAATSPKYDVPLGLHRLYVTGGSGALEAVI
jgi:hypothetical protein